jgi:hypothetical protein
MDDVLGNGRKVINCRLGPGSKAHGYVEGEEINKYNAGVADRGLGKAEKNEGGRAEGGMSGGMTGNKSISNEGLEGKAGDEGAGVGSAEGRVEKAGPG